MKNLLPTLLLLFICISNSYSQSNEIPTNVLLTKTNFSTEWATYIENENIKVEYKHIDCKPTSGYDFESVLLQITNKTNQTIELNWVIDLYYNGECKTCDYPIEYSRSVSLSPNSTITGDCDRQSDRALNLFSRFNDVNYSKGDQLTGFQLSALTIIYL
ncbi:MAG: hypothetical protein COA33_003800 [Fluviicola sp.]|nr:hypothetical protein [Fluviicola sp.]